MESKLVMPKTENIKKEEQFPVRNADCFNAIDALNKLIKMEVPLKTALTIRSMARKVQERVDDVRAQAEDMREKHIVLNEDGSPKFEVTGEQERYVFKPGGEEKFMKEYEELLNLEWDEAPKLFASKLGDITVSSATMLQLGGLIVDDLGD